MKITPKFSFTRAFSAALIVMISLPALAQDSATDNGITNIDYTVQQGGKVVITVGLKQALQAPPAGFAVNNPPRIALDFANTSNQWGKNSLLINEGAMRSVNLVQSGSRTRLVLNLSRPTAYETRSEGNQFIISLQGGSSSGVIANNTAQFAEARDVSSTHSLRDVDFRRGKNGEGRLVVDLSDASTGIDIRQQGKSLIIDFLHMIARRLNAGALTLPGGRCQLARFKGVG